MRIYIVSLVALAWLGGCASVVPEAIRTESPGNVQIAQVRDRPQQFRDAVVRWGGNIVSTRNEREHTVLEIIGRGLDKDGRPREEDFNLGRFLVKVQGFLDPAIYKPEREVTVRGRFFMSATEVTNGQYLRVVGSNPSRTPTERLYLPGVAAAPQVTGAV